MGHNMFLERHKKPNYKIHIVIFMFMVGVSIYLSTQVEKNKDKTNFVALKKPVPIDSVTIDDNSPVNQLRPTVQTPVSNPPVTLASFANQNDSAPVSEYAFEQKADMSALESVAEQPQANDAAGSSAAKPTDTEVKSNSNTTIEASVSAAQAENPPVKKSAAIPGSLDRIYDEQQDRFFQTLAKNAVVDKQESMEIKKIKQAIMQDKTLPEKTSTSRQSATANGIKKPATRTVKSKTIDTASRPFKRPSNQQVTAKKSNNIRVAINEAKPVASRSGESLNHNAPVLTETELDNIVRQFTRSYNKGNIDMLMALFHEGASTNDRKNKDGIEADYAELFSKTRTRNLMIKQINWQLRQGKAEGAATFEVTVQPINSAQATRYQGQIRITAEKQNQDVYITRLIHQLKQ